MANVLLIYSYNLYTRAAAPQEPVDTSKIAQQPVATSEEEDADQPVVIEATPEPEGTTIGLSFSIPGIGSGGGTMVPKHQVRTVTVFLYAKDASIYNKGVQPLYTIKSTVTYDANPASPTYTSYLNSFIDLGASIKGGTYQIAFKTEQSFRMLIKDDPDDVVGKPVTLSSTVGELEPFPHQTMIMGDIAPPTGNGSMDIDDFNTLFNCYGEKKNTSSCPAKNIADLNDDGVVDGLDYNIMLFGFQQLVKQGYPALTISAPPVVPTHVSQLSQLTPTAKPKKSPTPTPVPAPKASNSSALGGVLFFLFLIILGAIGFILYTRNPKVKALVTAFLKKSPIGAGAAKPANPPAASQNGAQPAQASGTPAQQPPAPQTPAPAASEAPAADPNAAKEYFVKKESDDPDGKGVWLSLTGDSGAISAHSTNKDVVDGFASVKGEMKTENGKTFLEISEIKPVG